MREKLREYVANELLDGRIYGQLGEEDDLLTSGLVDSLGIMSLVTFIEEEFGIRVPPEDVTLESFSTVASIAAYLERQKIESASSE